MLENSDDFVFDNQILAQCIHAKLRIGELSCPAKYFAEASSLNLSRSVQYGLGVLGTTAALLIERWGWHEFRLFSEQGRHITTVVGADAHGGGAQ